MHPLSSNHVAPSPRIAVFGASGHTGRFVVAELLHRGFDPIAIGRHRGKLAELAAENRRIETRFATVEDDRSLDRALGDAAAVINCAGPFLDTAGPVISAALRARISYLDITAEQPSVLATIERFAAPAQAAGIAIIPAMGFYGGLGDLLATAALGEWRSADDLRIAIALDRWHPTEGTRRTGARNTARRQIIADGQLQPIADPASATAWNFPEPFNIQDIMEVPLSETILIHRHLQVGMMHNYLNQTPLHDLHDATTPPPEAVDESGRSAQIFLMEVIARRGGEERRSSVTGRDIYAVTAPLVAEAVQQILGGVIDKAGVFAPGEIFDAVPFLRNLTPKHLIYAPAICA